MGSNGGIVFPYWNVDLFNRQIEDQGQVLLHSKVLTCPCVSNPGGNLSDCKNCNGTGFVYSAASCIRGMVYEDARELQFEDMGRSVPGHIKLVCKQEVGLSVLDRIYSEKAESIENEVVALSEELSGFTHYDIKCLDFVGLFRSPDHPITPIPLDDVYFKGRYININDRYSTQEHKSRITVKYRHTPIWRVESFMRESYSVPVNNRQGKEYLPQHAFCVRYKMPETEYNEGVQTQLNTNYDLDSGRTTSVEREAALRPDVALAAPSVVLSPDFAQLPIEQRRVGRRIVMRLFTDSIGTVTFSSTSDAISIVKLSNQAAEIRMDSATGESPAAISISIAATDTHAGSESIRYLHVAPAILPIPSITFTPSLTTLTEDQRVVGTSLTVSYTLTDANIVNISSSNQNIFTISRDMASHQFTIHYLTQGTALLEIDIPETATNNAYEDDISINVGSVPTQTLTLTITRDSDSMEISSTAANGTVRDTFTLSVVSDQSQLTNFTFASSDSNVASVTAISGTTNQATVTLEGVLSATLNTDTVNITITQPGVAGSIGVGTLVQQFTVNKKANMVTLTDGAMRTGMIGETITINASCHLYAKSFIRY